MNRFGIPEHLLSVVRKRDVKCVYCHKDMHKPATGTDKRDWATIEHLNLQGPFQWKDGLQIEDIVICCGSCNSSRGSKTHKAWFGSNYCLERGISSTTVGKPVQDYINK